MGLPIRHRGIRVFDKLTEQSWVVIPDFINSEMVSLLRQDLKQRQADGEFKRAGISKGSSQNVNLDIRSDSILWLNEDTKVDIQKQLFAKIEDLQQSLNRMLFLGLNEFEGHYAAYASGGLYQKHKDSFHRGNGRVVSFVLYLNESWQPEWGGQLRIFDANDEAHVAAEVDPQGGRLVLFMSSEIEHEVLPSCVERLSFTGWFLQPSNDSRKI